MEDSTLPEDGAEDSPGFERWIKSRSPTEGANDTFFFFRIGELILTEELLARVKHGNMAASSVETSSLDIVIAHNEWRRRFKVKDLQ